MIRIPHNYVAVLAQNVIVHIATLNRDGSPQVTPIWAESDGDFVRFSSSEGRVKVDNLRRDPRVALSFTDPDDWTTAFAMRGRVIAIEHRGWDLIDRLARRYRGTDDGFHRFEGMVRVDLDIEIDSVHSNK